MKKVYRDMTVSELFNELQIVLIKIGACEAHKQLAKAGYILIHEQLVDNELESLTYQQKNLIRELNIRVKEAQNGKD